MNEFDLFQAAREIKDLETRSAFLQSQCRNNPDLFARVEALLASDEGPSLFMQTPVVDQLADATVVGVDTARESHHDSSFPDASTDTAAFFPGSPYVPQRRENRDEEIPLGYLSPSDKPDALGKLGHYEVQEVLGRGAFGIVLKAFDEKLQRVVAIKVLAPEMAATSPARKRFLREARASASVRHEHVVNIHAVEEQPIPYLVMEYIPGKTLQERLDISGPIDILTVVRLGRQVAEGLAAAHDKDLIHRDIKPGNILLEAGVVERVKITDFGLARAADDASMTQSGLIAGTPMYMAPEQALGLTLDQRADLFSLGSVLYQMVSGRPPFRAPSSLTVLKRVVEEQPRPIPEIIPETPAWLCAIISKLHEKDRDRRFQTARELAEVLADCEAQLKTHAHLQDFTRIPRNPSARVHGAARRRLAVAALLVPLFVLGGLEWAGVTRFVRGPIATSLESVDQTRLTESSAAPASDRDATAAAPNPNVDGRQDAAVKQEAVASPEKLPPTFTNSLGMEFVIVPQGKSWLGGGKDNLGFRLVEITADFYLGKYEVSQTHWEQVMGENPSSCLFDAPRDYPVETVTWVACREFVARLNEREMDKGWVYRLPTEVEWEYACRGGPMSDISHSSFDFYFDKPTNEALPTQAHFGGDMTVRSGSFAPNSLGLYDMHGNVHEWCDDLIKHPSGEVARAHRGGCWSFGPDAGKAGSRGSFAAKAASRHLGLRLARFRASSDAATASSVGGKPQTAFTNSFGMEFVKVPKGKSWLGGGRQQQGEREVEFPADFYMGRFEVTQGEWEQVMGENRSWFALESSGHDAVNSLTDVELKRLPVEQVTWADCQRFVETLNQSEDDSNWIYRLPTEEEWEYACRGGPMWDQRESGFDYYFSLPTNRISRDLANCGHALSRTSRVGSYPPNRLGLHDMHGNVWEWCHSTVTTEGGAPLRTWRGGCWNDDFESGNCRAASRWTDPIQESPLDQHFALGLRVVRVPIASPAPKMATP